MINNKEYALLKSKFLKAYASVPEPLCNEIIAVIEDKTFTWRSARAEVMHDTERGKSILEHLHKMEVI